MVNAVLDEAFATYAPSVARIAPYLVTRLLADIERFTTFHSGEAQGSTARLICFAHPQILEVALQRYAGEPTDQDRKSGAVAMHLLLRWASGATVVLIMTPVLLDTPMALPRLGWDVERLALWLAPPRTEYIESADLSRASSVLDYRHR